MPTYGFNKPECDTNLSQMHLSSLLQILPSYIIFLCHKDFASYFILLCNTKIRQVYSVLLCHTDPTKLFKLFCQIDSAKLHHPCLPTSYSYPASPSFATYVDPTVFFCPANPAKILHSQPCMILFVTNLYPVFSLRYILFKTWILHFSIFPSNFK